MNKTEAVLFDVDGTLLDTREFIYRAFEHAFRRHGAVPAARARVDEVIGAPLLECYGLLAPEHDARALCMYHRAFQLENIHLSEPFPKAVEVLKGLREAGIRTAAVTSRSRRTSLATLESAGMMRMLDAVISGEDARRLKPHPDPLLLALAGLGVKPEKAFMVGDTAADILAGKNAGTGTIGVTYGFHGGKIKENGPDHTVDDISGILPIILK
ncbi:MAG TPA: HAD-IA family hydrolase [Elusimicrobiales bacterium]|nr:HAD-IA family hydrolase [Elusimicrobiales bacterium]